MNTNFQEQQTLISDPLLPEIFINDLTIVEGNTGTKKGYVTVRLSKASATNVKVNYSTADDSANNPSDYLATSGTLTFLPNQTVRTIPITIQSDLVSEMSEKLVVNLDTPINATINDSQGIITINNDDIPNISISDVTLTEGNNGTSLANFVVSLSIPSVQTVQLNYGTANQTAIQPSDYVRTTGTLIFNPGETSKNISIAVTGETLIENDQSFRVNLTSPINGRITDSMGIGTILDDDYQGSPFNYGEALQKSFLFYEAQRSGVLPANNRIQWRGNSALEDGASQGIDLTGGYYDAGDHMKFAFPMASSMTMLGWGVEQYRNAYINSGQLDEALGAIKWGTDWIIKANVTQENQTVAFWGQVGRGSIDHNYWGAAETMTMSRPAYKIDQLHPGSDLAAEAAAALASAAIIFRPTDPTYADLCLQNAQQLYQFADTYRGSYSNSITDAANYYNSGGNYQDELTWGAIWLYKATNNTTYLDKAKNYYQSFAGGLGNWTQTWGDKQQGSAVLLAQITNESQYRNHVEKWLDYWTNTNGSGISYTPGGLAWLTQWGSLRASANTAFLAGVYSDSVNDYNGRYDNFAQDQIDYILGQNPRNSSYMVGFGNNYPLRPHHTGAHGGTWNDFNSPLPNRNIIYGALVGGPKSANDYNYQDIRTDYVANEVALDYNAALTGTLARMYQEFGGQPLSDSQLDSLPGIVI
jgi:hypothetical protein